jgi:fructokinase
MTAARIGVDLGGTKTELLVLSDAGQELWRERRPSAKGSYTGIVQLIADMVETAEQQLSVQAAVGVGIPGSLSPLTGLVRNANTVLLNDKPFRQDLEQALGRPVRLENDANCMTLSEATDGAGQHARVVFAAILGTGCGGGIVVDGKIISGKNLITGEWGHYPLPNPKIWPHEDERPGPACFCGSHGCQETWLSGVGFAADFQRASRFFGSEKNVLGPQIIQLMRAGDAAAQACFDRYIDRLARALSVVVNLLDPDVIVLAGGMSNIAEVYSQIPSKLKAHVFSDTFTTPVVQAKHGDSSGVRGAAWLWPIRD